MIGRNEGDRLKLALTAATLHCEHVVYADSASTDASVERAQRLGVTVLELDAKIQMTAARGRKAGLERLLEDHPACRYVQFIDGDCILHPAWLNTAYEFLEDQPRVAAVCGRRYEAYPHASLYNAVIDNEWSTPVGEAYACGGDSLMRVEALRSAGSFRADLRAGEEPELCARLRAQSWQIWRIDAQMTEHDADIHRFGQWWQRAERGGFGYAQVWSATRDLPSRLYGRQICSALFWVVVVPLATIACASAITGWSLLLLPIIYAVQVLRIAVRRNHGANFNYRLKAAVLMMIVKAAEAKGVFRYFLGTGGEITSYKNLTIGHGKS